MPKKRKSNDKQKKDTPWSLRLADSLAGLPRRLSKKVSNVKRSVSKTSQKIGSTTGEILDKSKGSIIGASHLKKAIQGKLTEVSGPILKPIINEQVPQLQEYIASASESLPLAGNIIAEYFKREPDENTCRQVPNIKMNRIYRSLKEELDIKIPKSIKSTKKTAGDIYGLMDPEIYQKLNIANWKSLSNNLNRDNMPAILNLRFDNGSIIPLEFMVMYECKRHFNIVDKWTGVGHAECKYKKGARRSNIKEECITKCTKGIPNIEGNESDIPKNIKSAISTGCLLSKCCMMKDKKIVLCNECGGKNLKSEFFVFNLIEIVRQIAGSICNNCNNYSGSCSLSSKQNITIFNPVLQKKFTVSELNELRFLYKEALLTYIKNNTKKGQIKAAGEKTILTASVLSIVAPLLGFSAVPATGMGLLLLKIKSLSTAVNILDIWNEYESIDKSKLEDGRLRKYELAKRTVNVILGKFTEKYSNILKREAGPTKKASDALLYRNILQTIMDYNASGFLNEVNPTLLKKGAVIVTSKSIESMVNSVDTYLTNRVRDKSITDSIMEELISSGDLVLLLKAKQSLDILKNIDEYRPEFFDIQVNSMIYNQQKLLSKKFPMTNSFLSDERKVTKLIEECPDLDSERGSRRGMVSLGGGTMYNKIRNPNTGRYINTTSKLGKEIINQYHKEYLYN